LFITVKTGIALILQGVGINTHSVIPKKKRDSLHFSISSRHQSHIHTSLLISLKKNIEGGSKKKHSLHSLFLSLPPTQTPLIFISIGKTKTN